MGVGAIELVGGIRLHAGGIAERGEHVGEMDGHVATAAGLDLAGPADEERHAHAAFVERAFAETEGRVLHRVEVLAHAAVVAGEDDHRVVGQFQLVEHIENAAHGEINELQRGEHLGSHDVRLSLQPFPPPRLILRRHDMATMHGDVGHIQEEALLAVVADELNRVVSEVLRVAIGLAAVRFVGAEVEAVLPGELRREVLVRQMPLARDTRAIPSRLQRLHEGVTAGLHRIGQPRTGRRLAREAIGRHSVR